MGQVSNGKGQSGARGGCSASSQCRALARRRTMKEREQQAVFWKEGKPSQAIFLDIWKKQHETFLCLLGKKAEEEE